MVFSPDGTRLYVAHDGANAALSIIDTGQSHCHRHHATTPDTTGMAISSDGRTLYVADGYYNRIQVINTAPQRQSHTFRSAAVLERRSRRHRPQPRWQVGVCQRPG